MTEGTGKVANICSSALHVSLLVSKIRTDIIVKGKARRQKAGTLP